MGWATCCWTGCAWGDEQAVEGSGFAKKRLAQEKLQRVPVAINRPVEVHPHFFHFHEGFIDAPRVIGGFEVRSALLFDLWGVALHPPVDGAMIDPESALGHHLFQVTVAE